MWSWPTLWNYSGIFTEGGKEKGRKSTSILVRRVGFRADIRTFGLLNTKQKG
jgi:hypothetical protein